MPGEDMSWLTTFEVDDVATDDTAPLPAAAGEPGAEPKADVVVADDPTKAEVKEPVVTDGAAPLAAKPDAVKPEDAAAALADEELSPAEKTLIEAAPEAERQALKENAGRRKHFMDHYLGETPKDEVRQHLEQVSPSSYAELETAVIANRLSQPAEFCRDLFTRDPDNYSKLATEVYRGNPEFFTKQVIGVDGKTPEDVKTALEFYDRNKDRIDEEALSEIDEAKLQEMAEFFPEQVPILRAQLQAAAAAKAENAELKAKLEPGKTDGDAAKAAEAEAQATAARETQELWNLGRDTVGNYIESLATNPQTGAGITVTAAERQSSPLVALLKDVKATALYKGLMVDGKTILPEIHTGLAEWADGRDGWKETLSQMSRFTGARERDNVLNAATGAFPLAKTYYEERLKHPIFKQIDELMQQVAKTSTAAPKLDPQIPGALPSPAGGKGTNAGANANANSDASLIADALGRAG
jgi:hypothetical protein